VTVDDLMTLLTAGIIGYAVAAGLARVRLAAPPAALMRRNVSGAQVPAVLGGPLNVAGLTALACLALVAALGWDPARLDSTGVAVAGVIVVMAIAGSWDDRRGDERPRGFKGHLGALRGGRLTGGVLKILAGVVAGALAGALMFPDDVGAAVATALLVALGANTINLFDRAPGRAGKLVFLIATPLMALGGVHWAIAAAGMVGALSACLPLDLREKAMLGDAGANPLGALLGVGLAVSLPAPGRWVAVVALVALNLISERWSFSAVIKNTPWLNRLDQMGRK
jgi:UDP-N-acetylmuramyl pentapeptide phosphotransferase/UDP-N-acetylglucosamine-1-phosphate transferase